MSTLDEQIRAKLATDAADQRDGSAALAALRYQDTLRATLDYLNLMEGESPTARSFAVAIRRRVGAALGITQEAPK